MIVRKNVSLSIITTNEEGKGGGGRKKQEVGKTMCEVKKNRDI